MFLIQKTIDSPSATAALTGGIFAELKVLVGILHVSTLASIRALQIKSANLCYQQWVVALYGLYLSTIVMIKISVALSFLRIVRAVWQRRLIQIATIIFAIYNIAFCFIAVFQCGNPANYVVQEAEGKCLDPKIVIPLNYVSAALNISTDWLFVAIPVMVVSKSKMPKVTKISAAILLSLGAVASICSIVRLKFIPGLKPGHEFLHSSVSVGIWSAIETGLGITAISLSTLRPLFKSFLGSSGDHYGSVTARKNTQADQMIAPPVYRHDVDGLYRISVDDVCGITTTVAGPPGKGIEMDEYRKQAGQREEEISFEEDKKDVNGFKHRSGSEESLVSPALDRVMMTTEVVQRAGRR